MFAWRHSNIDENTKETIEREILEETQIQVETEKLLTIIENFFSRSNGDKVHELSFIYKVKSVNLDNKELYKDRIIFEQDEDGEKKLEFKWIPLEKITEYDVRPTIIKDIINNDKFSHFIIDDGNITELS